MAINRTIDFLPEYFRTIANQRFLGSTLDRIVSDPAMRKFDGYVGRRYANGKILEGNYVTEPSGLREKFQLEPEFVFSENGVNTRSAGFIDLLNSVAVRGGRVDQWNRLLTGDSYSFKSFVDLDKLTNYYNYVWIPAPRLSSNGTTDVLVDENPWFRVPIEVSNSDIPSTGSFNVRRTLEGFEVAGFAGTNPAVPLRRSTAETTCTYTFNVSAETDQRSLRAPKTVTQANPNASVTASDTQAKFTTTSGRFQNGAGLSTQSSDDFNFKWLPFTVEAWVYVSSVGDAQDHVIAAQWDDTDVSNCSWALFRTNNGADNTVKFNWIDLDTGSINSILYADPGGMSVNQWHHVAVARLSNTIRLYMDGVLVNSLNAGTIARSDKPLTVGVNARLTQSFDGYLEDLRITKESALYAAVEYQVPEANLNNDANTVLLIGFDGDPGATVFYDSVLVENSRVWIQTQEGREGNIPSNPNLDARDVLGVSNNGVTNGAIRFEVPSLADESYFRNLSLTGVELYDRVDLATTLDFNQIHNSLYDLFVQAPIAGQSSNLTGRRGGIDGVKSLNGKTLIFVNKQIDGWEREVPLELQGVEYTQYDQITPVTDTEKFGIWQIRVVENSYEDGTTLKIIQLELIQEVAADYRVDVQDGVTFRNSSWYKKASAYHPAGATDALKGFFLRMPQLSGNYTTLYLQDDQSDINALPLVIVNTEIPTLDVESEILCKPHYASGNGIEFINGLHVQFGSDTVPTSYIDHQLVAKVFTAEEILDSVAATEELTFALNQVSKIQSGDLLLIDDEYMLVTAVDLTLQAVTVVRPQENSVTAAHRSGAFVQVLRKPSWIVEGVGNQIVLVPYQDLTLSEQYLDYAQDPDYITINRASLDRNPWSRSNRWFNKQVVSKSLEYLALQGYAVQSPSVNYNAVRPIVEFLAGLNLYDFGTVALPTVNYLDDNKVNDALSKINGRTLTDTQNISVDGTASLDQYDLVIFNADTDPAVRQKIYQVQYVDVDGNYEQFSRTDVKAAATSSVNLSATGPFTIDGYTLAPNDRVLIWQQLDAADNGIYVYNGSTTTLQRASDADMASDYARGFYVKVTAGATYTETWFRYRVTATTDLIQSRLTAAAVGSAVLNLNVTGIEVGMRADFSGYSGQALVTVVDTVYNQVTLSAAITALVNTTINFCDMYLDAASDASTIVFESVTDQGPRVFLQEYATAVAGSCVSVQGGDQNRGTNWIWNTVTKNWIQSSQTKDQIQQNPLFDIYDFNDVSFGDGSVYNSTNFNGSSLFEYKLNPAAASDPVLNFGITYRTINNVGDISFTNTFETQMFNYISDTDTGQSQDLSIDTGTAKIVDPCTGTLTQYDVWQGILNNLELYQNLEITGANLTMSTNISTQRASGNTARDINIVMESVNDISVGMVVSGAGITGIPRIISVDTTQKTITLNTAQTVLDTTELTFSSGFRYDIPGTLLVKNTALALNNKIYVDGQQLFRDLYTVQQLGNTIRISISTDALDPLSPYYQNITSNSLILIKIIASTVLPNSWFDTPAQYEINPYNSRPTEFTLSDLKSHADALHSNHGHYITPLVTDNSLDNADHRANPGLIILHEGFSVLPTLMLTDTRYDIERAVGTASKDYEQFKLQFLDASEQVEAIETLSAAQAVDAIFRVLVQNKTSDQAWYTGDMVPLAGTAITYTVDDVGQVQYDLSDVFENHASNQAVLVYLNDQQLIRGKDYQFDALNPVVNILTTLRINNQLRIVEFANTDGSYVPATPAKLGLGPLFVPEIYLDDTYRTPVRVIQGHDGSIITAYNDYRDQLILELELRIFNNVKLDSGLWHNVIQSRVPAAGKFRELNGNALYTMTEEASIYRKYFYEWVANNRVNYSASVHADADAFTYNYSGSRDRISNELCLGYWRGIYRDFYDTDRPHTHPWEMLGITCKPTWWESVYGPAPYTGTNLILWQDLQNGTAYGGTFKSVLGSRTTSIQNPDNTGTLNLLDVVPVDSSGTLLNPVDAYLIGGLITSSARNQFTFNDNAPAETAWRRSSSFRFAQLTARILQNPQFMLGSLWDLDNYKPRVLLNGAGTASASYTGFRYLETQFPSITDVKLHAVDTDSAGLLIRRHSILNYVVEALVNQGQDPVSLTQAISDSKVNLVYKLAAFADVDNIQVYAEQNSVQTQGNTVKVPSEDYELLLSESVPIDVATYSGVIITRSANGYRITGYDRQYPYFIIYPSDTNTVPRQLQVGSQTYAYYAEFQNNPIYVPYDYEFVSKQTVVDFLISYGEHLARQGFIFDTQPDQDRINWLDAAVQFVKWSGYRWSYGADRSQNLSLVLNPGAGILKYTPIAGTLQNLMLPDNLILDENQNIISSRDIDVFRDQDATYINNLQPFSTISALRTNIVSYEHKLIVKNQTVFGDLIFNPALGIRQNRLRIAGLKTNDWDGTINSAGYLLMFSSVPEWQPNTDYLQGDIVKYKNRNYTALEPVIGSAVFQAGKFSISDVTYQNRLLPSIGAKTLDLERAYDVNHTPNVSDFTRLRCNALGYVERTWLANLGLDLNNQTEFYRGWVKEKGSFNAVDKFTSAGQQDLLADFTVNEEYAIKLGDYGATGRTGYVEVSLINDTESNTPMAVEFADGVNSPGLIRVSSSELYKKSTNWTTNFINNTGTLVREEGRFIDAGPVLPAEIYDKARSTTLEYSAEQEAALTFNSLESLTQTTDVQNLLKNVRYGNWIWIAVDDTLTTDNKYNVISWKNSNAKLRAIRKNFTDSTLELYLDQALDLTADQILVLDINDANLILQGAFRVVSNRVSPTTDWVSILSVTSGQVDQLAFDTVEYTAETELTPVYTYQTLRYTDMGSADLNRNLDKLYLPRDRKVYVDYNNLGWAVFDFREPYTTGSVNIPDSEDPITGNPEGLITTSIAQDDVDRWLWLGKADDNSVVVKSFRNTNLGLGVTGDLNQALATFIAGTGTGNGSFGERTDTLSLGSQILSLSNGCAATTATDSTSRGQVYILQAAADGYQVLQIFSGSASNAYYGASIAASVDGEWLFVSETRPSSTGQVYAYKKFNNSNTTANWTATGNASSSYTMTFTPDNLYSINVKVGSRIQAPVLDYSLSGNVISFTGSVSGLTLTAIQIANYYQPVQTIADPDSATGGKFGTSIDTNANGTNLVVGAPFNSTGKVYVFNRDVEKTFISSTSTAILNLGSTVGTVAKVIAKKNGVQQTSGVHYTPVTSGDTQITFANLLASGTIVEVDLLQWDLVDTISGQAADTEFGHSVAINGNWLVVGVPQDVNQVDDVTVRQHGRLDLSTLDGEMLSTVTVNQSDLLPVPNNKYIRVNGWLVSSGSAAAIASVTLGTGGQLTVTSGDYYQGQPLIVSGTLSGTGTITGYTNPTTYYISAVTSGTSITMTNSYANAVAGVSSLTTTAGTTTGLTFTLQACVNNLVNNINAVSDFTGVIATLNAFSNVSLSFDSIKFVDGITTTDYTPVLRNINSDYDLVQSVSNTDLKSHQLGQSVKWVTDGVLGVVENYNDYLDSAQTTFDNENKTVTTVALTFANSAVVTLSSVLGIQVGYRMTGTGVTGTPTVIGISEDTRSISLSITQDSLDAGTVLTFTDPALTESARSSKFDSGGTVFYDRSQQDTQRLLLYQLLETSRTVNAADADSAQLVRVKTIQYDKAGEVSMFFTGNLYRLWVGDAASNDEYNNVAVYTNNNLLKGWTLNRQQQAALEPRSIFRAWIYNERTKEKALDLDVVDIANGLLPGAVAQYINYISVMDPASYGVPVWRSGYTYEPGSRVMYNGVIYTASETNSTVFFNIDQWTASSTPASNTGSIYWGAGQVGQTWFSTSKLRTLLYEQGDLTDRISNYNRWFSDTEIIIREWIASAVPPAEYTLQDGSVNPAAAFVYSPVNNTYYFWIVNKTSVGSVHPVSAADISVGLRDIQRSGLPMIAPATNNSVILYNVKSLVDSGEYVLHIDYVLTDHNNRLHSEYQLMSEDNSLSWLKTPIFNKMVDSLSGIDQNNLEVPDSGLNSEDRYGVLIRPRQSMFRNREKALSIYFDVINRNLLSAVITNINTLANIQIQQDYPAVSMYQFRVPDRETLLILNTADYAENIQVLVESDRIALFAGWNLVKLVNGSWDTVSSQFYNLNGYWKYADWHRADYQAQPANYTLDHMGYLSSIVPATGDTVKILNNGDGKRAVYVYESDGTLTPVFLQHGTIQFLDNIYALSGSDEETFDNTTGFDNDQAQAIRLILGALNNNILVGNLSFIADRAFFAVLRYALGETGNLDWLFRTSFINVKHRVKNLDRQTNFRSDDEQFVRDFIEENKPFHTRIRDYVNSYNLQDPGYVAVSDFDLPALYDDTWYRAQFAGSQGRIRANQAQYFLSGYTALNLVDDILYIGSTGLANHAMGIWPNTSRVAAQSQEWVFAITIYPVEKPIKYSVRPDSEIGIAINGVPFYSIVGRYQDRLVNSADLSDEEIYNENIAQTISYAGPDSSNGYLTQNDAYVYRMDPVLLYTKNPAVHSPLLGFALDGYPIYGPHGYANVDGTGGIIRNTSSYQLKTDLRLVQQSIANGTKYATLGSPTGAYIEDWQYVAGAGTLDQHNGRMVITPEYPYGTYAYFVTVDQDDQPVYPYIIGPTFAGVPTGFRTEYQGETSVPVYDNGSYTMPSPAELAHTDWSLRSPNGTFYNDYRRFLQSPYRNWYNNYTHALVRLELADPGRGYTSAPTIVISGGGGSGAVAQASITTTGQIKDSDFIITPGTGYTSLPTVTVTGGQNVTVWSNSVSYSAGTRVSYSPSGGSTVYYESITSVPAGTALSNVTYWDELEPSLAPRAAVLVPVLENSLIRSFDITMKFDRVSPAITGYSNTAQYSPGETVYYNSSFYTANALLPVISVGSIGNANVWIELTDSQIAETQASNRITAFYKPTDHMVAMDLAQLLNGAEYSGTLVDGYDFVQTHQVPTGALADAQDQLIDSVAVMAQFDTDHLFDTVFSTRHRIQGLRSASFSQTNNRVSIGDQDNNLIFQVSDNLPVAFDTDQPRYIRVDPASPDLTELASGQNDFTFEFFFRMQTSDQQQVLVDNFNSTPNNGFKIYVDATNTLNCAFYNTTPGLVTLSGGSAYRDVWQHVAIERKNTQMSLYLDGNRIGSVTATTNFTSDNLYLGSDQAELYPADVYMDEIRLTRGLLRYDAADYTIPFTGHGRSTDQDVYFNKVVLLMGFESLNNEVYELGNDDYDIGFQVVNNRKAFSDISVNQKVLTVHTDSLVLVENQTITATPHTVIKTANGSVENSSTITLYSVWDLSTQMTLSGFGVTEQPKIVSIDTGTKIITLDSDQTIADDTQLTFTPTTGKSGIPAITVLPASGNLYSIIDAGTHADYNLGVEDFTVEYWYNDPVHQVTAAATANTVVSLNSVDGIASGMKLFETASTTPVNVNSVNAVAKTVTLASAITLAQGDRVRFVKTNVNKTVFVLSDFITANITANVSASTVVSLPAGVISSLREGMYVDGTQISGSNIAPVVISDIDTNDLAITLSRVQTLTMPAELKFNRSNFSLTGQIQTNTSGQHRTAFYVRDAYGVKQSLISDYYDYADMPLFVSLDRHNSILKMFVNGTLVQSVYAPWDFGDNNTPLPVILSSITDPFVGRLADFRITQGISRYGQSSPIDTAITSDFADQYLGVRATDITVDGSGFINNITGGSTEEHVNGRLYDTLDIRVFSQSGGGYPATGFRIFQDMMQNIYYYAVPAAGTTTLSANLSAYADTVYLTSVAGFPDTNPGTNNRGAFFVGGERISYLFIDRDANTLSGLLRGTLGTHIPQTHLSGARAEVASQAEQFPGSAGAYGVIGTVAAGSSGNTVTLVELNNITVGMRVQEFSVITLANGTSTGNTVTVGNATGILTGMQMSGATTVSTANLLPRVTSVAGNIVSLGQDYTVYGNTLLKFSATVDSIDAGNSTVTLSSNLTVTANGLITLGEIESDSVKPFTRASVNTLTYHNNTWYDRTSNTSAYSGNILQQGSSEVAVFLVNKPALLP